METDRFGWAKSSRFGKQYHFFEKNERSVCGIAYRTEHIDGYYRREELDDVRCVCHECRAVINYDHPPQIEKNRITVKRYDHLLKKVTCDEPGCSVRGGAYVSTDPEADEKEHYCQRHNRRISR